MAMLIVSVMSQNFAVTGIGLCPLGSWHLFCW